MTSIRAAVMTAPGALEVRELPRPEIGPDELLLKIERTGICGSDKHMYAGHMALQFPVIPGHELVGTVAELGSAAGEAMAVVGGALAEGDRVTTTPSSQACGRCHYCCSWQASCRGVRARPPWRTVPSSRPQQGASRFCKKAGGWLVEYPPFGTSGS